MRLLVTGASGFIGQHLLGRLRNVPGLEVSGTYRHRPPQGIQDEGCRWYPAELNDPAQLDEAFRMARPDVVVHLAALSDVDANEDAPHQATAVNVRGTEHIARLCARHRARLVFLSTDYVFAGDRGYYREDETPSPSTRYGATKWEAEQAIARELSDWSVLRTCLVYGWPPAGGHGSLPTGIARRLGQGEMFNGYTDMYRTPTYVGDVVEGILKLAEEDHPGVYHVAGLDWVNMYQFASAVARVFYLDWELVKPALAPVEGSEGRKPRLLGLDSTRTAMRLGIQLSGVVAGLERMRKERKERRDCC